MKLSSIFNNGMILQRDQPIKIFGTAKPFETIELLFKDLSYETKCDKNGYWEITLKPSNAGGPYNMTIKNKENQIYLHDILIGDIWVLSGQSNMELPLKRTLDLFSQELKNESNPFIRQFSMPMKYNFHHPQQMLDEGHWITAKQESLLNFSAVGYFFAKELYEQYQIPIGLIQTAVGGTPIEAWIPEASLRKIGGYEDDLEACKKNEFIQFTQEADRNRQAQWFKNLNKIDEGIKKRWASEPFQEKAKTFIVPNSWEGTELEHTRGAVWFQKKFDLPNGWLEDDIQLKLGTIIDADETYINGVLIGQTGYRYPPRRYHIPNGTLKKTDNLLSVRIISTETTGAFVPDMPYKISNHDYEIPLDGEWLYNIGAITEELKSATFFQYKPSGVYNALLAPLHFIRIKGVLWYQGESNTDVPEGYHKLFQTLVNNWRSKWQQDLLPVIFTQLSNFETHSKSATDSTWAMLREEQRKCLDIPHTAMAVTIDVGEHNDLHPQDKKSVGKRLSLCAKHLAYGESIVYSGPLLKKVNKVDSQIILDFDHAHGGLLCKGKSLQAFTICGEDLHYLPAKAEIRGNSVIVFHEQISQPMYVRYGWSDNPSTANLYNKEGLPASPFTTE
ncbi:sialate O-acetylesterase [Alkalihalobacillus trypoxylicola]|uniref:9-O-acetylesterase n=1 Tax=Alkalihalobacillus trypoxylicola TaxID=519424 RepID=A0A161QDS6_9BACI|nr:sialate O-acetylesterase [Alkalihalobacillus trypoxylicola]KYG26607.1 9-O-acetylesterase [Alkalihalobacillus trypoxylicola]